MDDEQLRHGSDSTKLQPAELYAPGRKRRRDARPIAGLTEPTTKGGPVIVRLDAACDEEMRSQP
jgi:hypothetical protein